MTKQAPKQRIFRFKQFEVCDDQSAHKVGVDSVLCGSWAAFHQPKNILDVGTGCGLLSLMMAQRFSSARCIGIDISLSCIAEAAMNFRSSPWPDRLSARHASLQQYVTWKRDFQFDAIISNPPYFRNDLWSTQEARRRSRHDVSLPRKMLFSGISSLLDKEGSCCLSLPSKDLDHSLKSARETGLFASRISRVASSQMKPSKFSMVKFTKIETITQIEELIIGVEGNRSLDFKALTGNFYL